MKKYIKLAGFFTGLCLVFSMLSFTSPAMAYTRSESTTSTHTPLTVETAKEISDGTIRLETPGAIDM